MRVEIQGIVTCSIQKGRKNKILQKATKANQNRKILRKKAKKYQATRNSSTKFLTSSPTNCPELSAMAGNHSGGVNAPPRPGELSQNLEIAKFQSKNCQKFQKSMKTS